MKSVQLRGLGEMKIGVLTFFRSNYGALMQAYALQSALRSLGHYAELIDYEAKPSGRAFPFDSQLWAKKLVLRFFEAIRYPSFNLRRRRFGGFLGRHMVLSDRQYRTSRELAEVCGAYDTFISGSDQVWRPSDNHDRNTVYYLGFVRQEQAKKISYAPSFGVPRIAPRHEDQIRQWILDIPHLSVREETGKAIIAQATGRAAEVVLDPTFLLERNQWERIASASAITIPGPYLLIYSTSQRGLFLELAQHLKRKLQIPVVVLSLTPLNLISIADRVIYDAGPQEFVRLIADATCVCTNSFHGTAFSIIFRKPFWNVPHNMTNPRIADLLGCIGLSGRQAASADQFPQDPLVIDYNGPSALLEAKRRSSLHFLKTALQQGNDAGHASTMPG